MKADMDKTNSNQISAFEKYLHEAMDSARLLSQALEQIEKGLNVLSDFDADHPLATSAADKVLHFIQPIFSTRDAFTVEIGVKHFMVDHIPLISLEKSIHGLHKLFVKMEISAISFNRKFNTDQALSFLSILSHAQIAGKKRRWIAQKASSEQLDGVTFEKLSPIHAIYKATEKRYLSQSDETVQRKLKQYSPQKLYQIGIGLIKDMFEQAHPLNTVCISDINCAAANITNAVLEKPDEMIALAIASRMDSYHFSHPVNVAIFSILTAQSVFNDPEQLSELASIAMLFDVGKRIVPMDILNKESEFTDEDLDKLHTHPIDSALLLDEHLKDEKLAVVVAYEHHMNQKGSGYPSPKLPWQPNLYTRIIRVAEAYDSRIKNDIYRKPDTPLLSTLSLLKEWEDEPESVLMTRLISRIGIFPAGTIVALNSGNLGLVIRQVKGRPLDPIVKIIADPHGRIFENGEMKKTDRDFHIAQAIPIHEIPFNPLDYYPFQNATNNEAGQERTAS